MEVCQIRKPKFTVILNRNHILTILISLMICQKIIQKPGTTLKINNSKVNKDNTMRLYPMDANKV